jgi:hydrogenase maturation protein HypF
VRDFAHARLLSPNLILYRLGLRRRLHVHGIVQGVGFRPWVYKLARRFGLTGYVLNSTLGVEVDVEGSDSSVAAFLAEFRAHPPALAQMDEILEEDLPPDGASDFVIRSSRAEAGEFVLVPPDIATCPECLADLRDPSNRRYAYPFTNCTNCGPRYSIICDIPYDRPQTTMAEFPMCAACEAEYHNPMDRRFHAQPNACPACGPWVELWDREKRLADRAEAIGLAREMLRAGKILAVKGLGGFHLACNATDDAAVRLLRERKRRSDKPFALMAADVEAVWRFCELDDAGRAALNGIRRPVALLPARAGCPISPAVAPGNRTLGVMLPYTPLHHLLFDGAEFQALVMTSANLSEEPIAFRNEEIAARLHPLADFFLIHNRKIHTRLDDSVVRTFEGKERTIRRSRGYAPLPIDLGMPVEPLLACGGELKNTLCLTRGHYALLSQHIGDLENLETLALWEETLDNMKRFFRVRPRAVAYDLHPHYLTTRLALAMEGVEQIGVQHHHAHIASCMAENRLRGKVIGVAMDGTGYGIDGKIWGGEVLVCDYADFERVAHFRYVPLAGGDTAIRQPWRVALAYARDAGLNDLPFLDAVPAHQRKVVETMLLRKVNTVESSSCGRLFDAVSAILGLRLEANYEAQAAIELESIAAQGIDAAYPFDLDGPVIDFRETVRRVAADREHPELASAQFHNTVAAAIAEICRRMWREEGLDRVCLSGGTFQNLYLLRRTVQLLRADGFAVFLHSKAPPNDGGLCLGQAAVANAVLSR